MSRILLASLVKIFDIQLSTEQTFIIFGVYGQQIKGALNLCRTSLIKYVTLSAKTSLILGENKAAFCREGHK